MKPDMKLFPQFTEEEHFRKWWKTTSILLAGHGMEEVITFDYEPTTAFDERNFNAKNKYFYAILHEKVKVAVGKDIVRRLEDDKDGREAMRQIREEFLDSTAAEVQSEDIMQWIVTTQLDNSWTKTIGQFLILFNDKMDEYNELVQHQPGRILTEDQKKVHLQRAIETNRTLNAIRSRERDRIAMDPHATKLTYSQYLSLLKSEARLLDKKSYKKKMRSANFHAIDEESSGSDEDGKGENEERLAYPMFRSKPGSKMNKETWKSLSNDGQATWDKLSDADKASILSYATQRAEKSESRQANVHESTETEEDIDGKTEDTDDDDGASDGGATQLREANSLKTRSSGETNDLKGKAHAADPRRMMGGKPNPKVRRKVNHVHILDYYKDSEPDDVESEGESVGGNLNLSSLVEDCWDEEEQHFW